MPSGRPKGVTKDKPWADALRVCINEIDPVTRIKKLRLIAKATVDAAIMGDMQAIREIGDRIDGKPQMAIEHSGAVGTYTANEIPVEPRDSDPLAIPSRPATGGDTESIH